MRSVPGTVVMLGVNDSMADARYRNDRRRTVLLYAERDLRGRRSPIDQDQARPLDP